MVAMAFPDLALRHLLRRGLRCWVLVRLGLAAAFVATMNPPLAAGGLVGLGVIGLTLTIALVEGQRVRERVVLANLGVSLATLLLTLASAAVLGEVLLAVLTS
jgi:hypothetical protein